MTACMNYAMMNHMAHVYCTYPAKVPRRFLEDAYRHLCAEQKAIYRKEKNGPNSPNNNWERQKRQVPKAVSDAAWGEFIRQLEYQCEWYGKTLVKVDRCFPSTRRCSACGHTGKSNSLSVREWVCTECGCVHDRAINAATNLSRVGQARAKKSPGEAPGDQRTARGASRRQGSGR